jgi:hypothetical protein
MKKTILLVLCYILLIFVAQVSKADDSIYRKLIAPENFSESCFYDDGQTNCPKNQECGYNELYNCDYAEDKFKFYFSGNYIIVREDHYKNRYDNSLENYYNLKIFDSATGDLINTIGWRKLVENTKLEEEYENDEKGLVKKLNYSCRLKFYGNFLLLWEHDGRFLKLMNLTDSSTIFYTEFENSDEEGFIKSITLNNEKIVLIHKSNTSHRALSYYDIANGKFYLHYLTWEKDCEDSGLYIDFETTCGENEYDTSTGYYTAIVTAYKDYVLLSYGGSLSNNNKPTKLLWINLEDKKFVEITDLYEKTKNYLNSNFRLANDYYLKKGFLSTNGNIIFLAYAYDTPWFILHILKYNPLDDSFNDLYTKSKSDFDKDENAPINHIKYVDFNNGYIYFVENIGDSVKKYNLLKKIIKYVNGKCKSEAENVTFDVWTLSGSPYLRVNNKNYPQNDSDTGLLYYNILKISENGGDVIPITNDFPYYVNATSHFDESGEDFSVKKNTIFLRAYYYRDGTINVSSNPKYNVSCQCDGCYNKIIEREDKENSWDGKLFITIGNADKLENYADVLTVKPVVPAKRDESSVFKEGTFFYRTYKITDQDDNPAQGAKVTSATNYESTADDNGIVNVKNKYDLDAGEYDNKTIGNIISSIVYNGKEYVYNYSPDSHFKFVVKDAQYSEKKIEIEIGGKVNMGIGAAKFGTIKAATVDVEAKKATGIYFNQIKDNEDYYLEMGRHIKEGVGANAVLAEAKLYGEAQGTVSAGISLSGVGSQIYVVPDPFADANTESREVLTAFLWDTLVKNQTLYFPGAGPIIDWIWDHILPESLNNHLTDKSAGLEFEGSVESGVELPSLELDGEDSAITELSAANLNNLGIEMPSIGGGFLIGAYLHRYSDDTERFGIEFGLTTELSIDTGIFDGIYAFSGLPELPPGSKTNFGVTTTFDPNYNLQKFYLNYSSESEEGDNIVVKESELSLNADKLIENISAMPKNIERLAKRENLSDLSWDTKKIKNFFKDIITELGKDVSGEFVTYKDTVSDTSYEFEIGLGLGLNFGIGAHFNYLEHERKLEKRYKIDSLSQGMAIVEDQTNINTTYPDKTLGDILKLTLDYLKDKVADLYNKVKKVVQEGVDTVITSGKAVLRFGADKLEAGYNAFLTTFTPWSSEKSKRNRFSKIPKSTLSALISFAALNDNNSGSVGEAGLVNIYDSNEELVDSFASGEITFNYDSDDLSNAGLTEADEIYFFIWKFRSIDHKFVKVGGELDAANNKVSYDNVTTNGIYGIGYDRTKPEVKYKNLNDKDELLDNYLYATIKDDFSGIDNKTLTVKIDNNTVLNGDNASKYYDISTGKLLIPDVTKGEHKIEISVYDTAGNLYSDEKNIEKKYDNMSDYDGDNVPNYKDGYPYDPNKSELDSVVNLAPDEPQSAVDADNASVDQPEPLQNIITVSSENTGKIKPQMQIPSSDVGKDASLAICIIYNKQVYWWMSYATLESTQTFSNITDEFDMSNLSGMEFDVYYGYFLPETNSVKYNTYHVKIE